MRCSVQYASWCWCPCLPLWTLSHHKPLWSHYDCFFAFVCTWGSGLLPEFLVFSSVSVFKFHFLVQYLCCLFGSTGFVLVWRGHRVSSCRGQSLVPQQTIAVSTYALAKSGYKDCATASKTIDWFFFCFQLKAIRDLILILLLVIIPNEQSQSQSMSILLLYYFLEVI